MADYNQPGNCYTLIIKSYVVITKCMMYKVRLTIFIRIYVFIAILFLSQHYAEAQNKPVYGLVTLQFSNVAGAKDLQLDSGIYTNASGEQFTVTELQYFITNIKLTTVDDKQYIIPQNSSYFLINESDSASHFCIIRIPAGAYKSISFMVGVDSLRNTMDIDKRTGILDPANSDMYWQWNSGYICLKMEGISAAAPADPLGLHKYRYHIGGFGGYKTKALNNVKTVTLNLTNKLLMVAGNDSISVNIRADVLKIFSSKTNISIAQHPAVMFNPFSAVIADNYTGMFSIADVVNK